MNRNILILMGILAVLAVLTFFILQRPGEQSVAESGGTPLLAIDSSSVDRIDIRTPRDSVVLVRQGDWFLDYPLHYRANQQSVKSLVSLLKNADVKTVVSDKPEKQSLFQVDSSGTVVSISENGKRTGSLVIGKMGPSYADVYVRVAGTQRVILTDGLLSSPTHRSLNDWRDKAITNIPKDQIKQITFQYGDTTFVLAWRDSVWMIGNEHVPSGIVNPILTSLANLETDEFLENLPSPGPHMVAVISFEGLQLKFFQVKGSDKFIVQSSGSPQVFEIQGWRADQVLKRKHAFLKVPS